MFKYKTKGGEDFVVPGVGITVNGMITSPFPIENPNLELIKEEDVERTEESAHMNGISRQHEQPAAVPKDEPKGSEQ